jgi:hypothetical protein
VPNGHEIPPNIHGTPSAPLAPEAAAAAPIRRWRFSDLVSLLLIALMLSVLVVGGMAAAATLPVQDLAQYWAGAHLVTVNPYSQDLVASFERSYGLVSEGTPMVMRNPPQALLLVLPLRFLNYRLAFALWDLVSIVLIAGCARAAYSLIKSKPSLSPALLSLLFGPTAALLMLGQIVVLVLLAVTLFLLFVQRKKDWLAGAALFLAIPKPHLLFLFVAAVVLWTVTQKRWPVIISALLTTTLASIAIVLINPHVFAQYFAFVREFSRETTPYPNLGGILYTLSGKHFLAYFPLLLGIVWFAVYWVRNHRVWDWNDHGATVLIVSVVCSYYSFAFDQIVVLPALIIAFAAGNRLLFYAGFLITDLGYILYISGVAGHFGFGPMFLWWTSPALLLTYLLSRSENAVPEAS